RILTRLRDSITCHTIAPLHYLRSFFFFQAEDGIRDRNVTGVQTCALPILPLSTLSIALQQLVAISRATVTDSKVLILDEPTSSLDASEVENLFTVIRALRDEGVAILLVSHFLDQ